MKSDRDIFDYTAEYLKSPFLKENNWYRRRAIIRELKKYNHARVLEIGCGGFPLISFIDSNEYDFWTIVEPSRVFIDVVRRYIDANYLHAKVHLICDLFENVILNDEYDFVICSSLLHEVNDPQMLLECILKTCGNNTIVHINVPNANSIHRLIAYYGGKIHDIHTLSDRNTTLQQRTVYDIKSLSDELENMGFEIIDQGSFFIKPFTHAQMGKMVESGIVDESVMEGLWGLAHTLPEYGSEIFVNARRK